jgi:hypothetical protein
MRISPVVRFLMACCLFAGWMGYLVYLAATAGKPVVLSRPQLLVSKLDVLARIDSPDEPVVVEEVLLRAEGVEAPDAGDELTIANLRQCKRLPHAEEDPEKVPLDWTGPGVYLLPLQPTPDGRRFVVAEVPPSPGYPPPAFPRGTPRIYRATDEVMREYRAFRSP